jgi:hypothetical protein
MCSVASATSNNSATERLSVPLGNCATNIGFNHDVLCGECYCQPYLITDTFTTQLSLFYGTQDLIRIQIFSADGLTILANTTTFNSTTSWNEYGVQSTTSFLMSDMATLAGTDCFRLKFVYDFESYMSEPYCLIQCTESSVLICSDYDNLDCNNRVWSYSTDYYTTPGTITPMSNCIRLKAVVDYKEVAIENTYLEVDTTISSITKHTKSRMIENKELNVWKIPQWQVQNLKAILGGKNLSITIGTDTQYYQVKGGFTKGNDNSSMWFPTIKLEKVCQIFNKSC